jgi:dTDP-4-amino-4,6-dideoxygalactose transaminase
MQAAILRVKLRHLDRWNSERRELARKYNSEIGALGVEVPVEAPGCRHVYHQYVVALEERERVRAELQEAGVATALYYPAPLHLLGPCRHLVRAEDRFPIAERAAQRTVALPFYPEMSDDIRRIVTGALARAIERGEVPA